MTANITTVMLMPEAKFNELQKGPVQVLLGRAVEGDRISVGIHKPKHPMSEDDAKELRTNPKLVAVVEIARTLDSQNPTDVRDFAKYLKASEDDARAELVRNENDSRPYSLVTLTPELTRPSLQSTPTADPKSQP